MPDATYVGAGMPCGNCGNPLTPGQPHKCGRVGNPYAPSSDWKPGQDTFTAQAAGIWDEGFAAGRAAATPDPPDEEAVAAIVRVLNRTMDLPARERAIAVLAAAPAASPDERPQTDADCQDDCTAHRTCVERRGGAWAEGYAAGKVASDDAAACDERDKAVEAVSVAAIHHVEAMREMRGKVDELRADRDRMKQAFRDFRADAEAIPAASPDERLREALREIVDTAPGIDRWTIDRRLDDEQWTGKVAVEVVRASSVDVMVAALRAALAAADRDKPSAGSDGEDRPDE